MRDMSVKIAAIFLFILISGILIFAISIPLVNDNVAENTAENLEEIPLPENTQYIEKVSLAGKVVGNGNGMQYFGAILIKSGLTVEELQRYYSGYAENEWECIVERQNKKEISIVEHGFLEFQTNISEDNYYIVYSWGRNDSIFHEFDLRGH